MSKLIRGVLAGAAAVAVGVAGFSATAVADAGRPGGAPSDGLNADVLAAVKRDVGLDAAEAKARAATQTKSLEADEKLKGKLGADHAGSWLDRKSGKLVVAVSDAADVATVKAAGAQAKLVKHSKSELNAIVAELDRKAGKRGGAERAKPGKAQASVAALTAWSVDATSNEVAVSVVKGKQAAAKSALAKYGDAVRIEQLPAAPTSVDFMDGGDVTSNKCSAGFNLRNPSTGQGYLLSAGHCWSVNETVTGQGGHVFGTVVEKWFPTFDDALIKKTNSYWTQGPWVDTNPSNGGFVNVYGYSDAPVGTLICKSGITTKLTCGYITAKDQTVTFDGVNTVYGLTRHDACVEKGDSGGANYQLASTRTAEGVSSGAALYGTAKRCGSAVGQPDRKSVV